MKLVEILARELKEWPSKVKVAVQDNYDCNYKHVWLCSGKTENIARIDDRDGWLIGSGAIIDDYFVSEYLASDRAIAIVTRADWEAERARIGRPAKKAGTDNDGWQRARGRKPNYEELPARKMQVRHRDKSITEGWTTHSWNWDHEEIISDADIMAFRIENVAGIPAEKPVIEPAVLANVQEFNESAELRYDPCADGPLQWRDRITEIDASVEALEEERASLVQRLEAEGFRLIERAVQPLEDMSDCKKVKVGDFLKFINESNDEFTKGRIYEVLAVDSSEAPYDVIDDEGDENCLSAHECEFYSHPPK